MNITKRFQEAVLSWKETWCDWIVNIIVYSTEYTEWQRPLSGVHSIMMEKLGQAGEGGGCTPTLSFISVTVILGRTGSVLFLCILFHLCCTELPMQSYLYDYYCIYGSYCMSHVTTMLGRKGSVSALRLSHSALEWLSLSYVTSPFWVGRA
jgi:hypothetical protein